jgi:hypothetical protein
MITGWHGKRKMSRKSIYDDWKTDERAEGVSQSFRRSVFSRRFSPLPFHRPRRGRLNLCERLSGCTGLPSLLRARKSCQILPESYYHNNLYLTFLSTLYLYFNWYNNDLYQQIVAKSIYGWRGDDFIECNYQS